MNLSLLPTRDVHPGIAGLAEYCVDLAGEFELPRRNRFRPTRVSSIITYLFLIDVLEDEDDYLFHLSGSNLTLLYGEDFTGKRLSEVADSRVRAALRETYDRVVATRQPYYLRGRYEWPEMSIEIERLLVPMTDDAGAVTTILGVAIPNVSSDVLLVFAGRGAAQLVVDEVLAKQ